MRTIAADKSTLPKLLAESRKSHGPIKVKGKQHSVVILSLEDWKAIEETLYLMSLPKMRSSIRRGLKTPAEKCSRELPW